MVQLSTEARHPRTLNLDALSTRKVLEIINREDQKVPVAIHRAIPQIARAVNIIVERMKRGGRLIYVGAGTSGRLGILDAVECVPTFNTAPEQIQGIIAGGFEACYRAIEASEDDVAAGVRDLRKKKISKKDVLVGIAASGRTPYTCGALQYARSTGAKTVAIVNNPHSEMKKVADVIIEALTGPEVLTGSTRMKAGTAQKMICNMLSTAVMVRLGAVYSNLMINVHMKNEKLLARGVKILREMTGVSETRARRALEEAQEDLRVAAVMLKRSCDVFSARKILNQQKGNLRKALGSPNRPEPKSEMLLSV